jgi:hypothetical protein
MNKEKSDMKDPAQPLAEVFGHLITDQTEKTVIRCQVYTIDNII